MVIKKLPLQIRDFLRAPGSVRVVIVLILTVLDTLIFHENSSGLLSPTIIGGLQAIFVAVATYLPLFAMVVAPTNFLALTFLPTEQVPVQIFCAPPVVEVMCASSNKIPARIITLFLLVISNYDVNISTFARDHVVTFVITLLFVITCVIGMMCSRYKEQRRQATIESNRVLEEQCLELATVLHDFIAKLFTCITMLIQALAIEQEGTDEKLEQPLEDIAKTSREGLLQFRQLLSLLKSADDENSLTSAIGQGE